MSVQSTATAADIGLLSACAFLGTIGASLTGFGQAIIFLFVWQIVELAGYNGDFKSAVFIQALSLFSMQPLVLYKAKVWKNAHRRVLLLFVPITLVSTPLGQLVSDGVPTSIVQAVAGVLVTFVACWELYSKRNWFLSLSLCNKKSKGKKDGQVGADDDGTADHAAEWGEAGVVEVGKESNEPKKEEIISTNGGDVSPGPGDADASNQLDSESLGKAATTTTDNSESNLDNNEPSRKESAAAEAATPPKSQPTISSVYASLAAEPNSNVDMSISESSPSPQSNNEPPIQQEDEVEEQLKIGINTPTLMTLLAGGKFFYSIENSLSITYCVDTHDQPLSPSIL